MNNYSKPGDTRDWTNGGTAVSSGDVVVVGQQLAIAAVDIANGETGSVTFVGEFVNVPKATAAVILDGEMVIWDVSNGDFDDNAATPAAGDVSNAAVAAGDFDGTVSVMTIQLANRIGTVT